MKHFLIEITYTASMAEIDACLVEHREFLQRGYNEGYLLCSGPQVPRTGGVIIARAPELTDIEAFFAQDPFQKQKIAKYRFVEFQPVKCQSWLQAWVNGDAI